MPRFPALAGLTFALLIVPTLVAAQPPAPIDATLYAFPGSVVGPASGASAGLALSDRWIADEPFDNPAVPRTSRLTVSPMLLRVSRQDLRAENRNYDESPAFLDVAGASIAYPWSGLTFALYASQPALRLEDNAFERGEAGGPVQPAVVQSRSTLREWRAGLGLSTGGATLRGGAAVEWSQRSEDYEYHEQSGSPGAGDQRVEFSGGGVGFQAGVRWEAPEVLGGPLVVGAAGRYVPELSMEGTQVLATGVADTTAAVASTLQSGTELGASIRYGAGDAFWITAGAGTRSARDWESFGVRSGQATQWSVAVEYHDPEEAWTVSFGLGQERQDDVPEPRAGMIGLGFGWRWEKSGLDLGVLRRTLEREGLPNSVDDRVIASFQFSL
jgi:hypothetical protein